MHIIYNYVYIYIYKNYKYTFYVIHNGVSNQTIWQCVARWSLRLKQKPRCSARFLLWGRYPWHPVASKKGQKNRKETSLNFWLGCYLYMFILFCATYIYLYLYLYNVFDYHLRWLPSWMEGQNSAFNFSLCNIWDAFQCGTVPSLGVQWG